MQISLSEKATMWFLGTPKNIKINLNFQDKGPEEVDFERLDLDEQKHILLSLQRGTITTDSPFQDLHSIYKKKQIKDAPPPVVQEYLNKKKGDRRQEKLLKVKVDVEKRLAAIQKRCKWLAKQTMRAIKAELGEEKDVKMLRSFWETEKTNKNLEFFDWLRVRLGSFRQK